jgi:nondiscriminating glutamyl-tRNA synthetase
MNSNDIMATDPPRLRMAPAPSGFLHLGNVRTFLFDYLYARGKDGKLVLRIEDTDASRSTAEAEAAIFESLHWLGIDWDEGPDVGGPHAPYRQSEREESHRQAAHALLANGHAYECFCTEAELAAERTEQRARGQAPRYSRRCLRLSEVERQAFRAEGRVPAIRFHMPEDREIAWDDLVYGRISFQSDDIGDFIILRANGTPIYNLANVVDDHGMEITVGLRSQSHLSNTPRQIALYEALGWTAPDFAHVPDVNDLQGRKLGKRYGAKSVAEYRAGGYLPEAIINYIALLGWSSPTDEEFLSMDDLRRQFSFDRVQRSNAAFDPDRLEWFNAQSLRRMLPDELARRALPFLRDAGLIGAAEPAEGPELGAIMPLVAERVRTLGEIPPMVEFFFREPSGLDVDSFLVKGHTTEQVGSALAATRQALATLQHWTSAAIVDSVTEVAEHIGWKRGDLFMALRIAITGRKVSPPLTESMEMLGRETTLRRVDSAIDILARQASQQH